MKLPAEDLLETLWGDRGIDPSGPWVGVAQEILNVLERHTPIRKRNADRVAERVERKRACDSACLQVSAEDPFHRYVMETLRSTWRERDEDELRRAPGSGSQPSIHRLDGGIGDRLEILAAPFAGDPDLASVKEQIVELNSNDLRDAKR